MGSKSVDDPAEQDDVADDLGRADLSEPRPRGPRRLLWGAGALAVAGLLGWVLTSDFDADLSTSSVASDDVPSTTTTTEDRATAPAVTPDTTTTSSPADPSVTSTTNTQPPAPPTTSGTPDPGPTVVTSTPASPTTTTTIETSPWEPNSIGFGVGTYADAGEETGFGFAFNGVFDALTIDWGDGGVRPVAMDPSLGPPWPCDYAAGPPFGVRHAYATRGVYTATLTVHGSNDCATARSSFRTTTVSVTFEVGPVPPG